MEARELQLQPVTIRPSSLPMLAQCPRFEAGDTSAFADEGTQRHTALAAALMQGIDGARDFLDALDDESREGVEWAANYILLHAPTSEYPLCIEERVNPLDDEFQPYFENGGTRDVGCGPHVFDFKWRERNYDEQMAAYCLDKFDEGFPEVTVHVLFGATRRAVKYRLDAPSAKALVLPVIASAKDPNATEAPCDYCGWCAKRLTCKPYLRVAKRVAEGYADDTLLAQVKSWHPSQMETAEEIALGLTIARKLLGPWCKSMEHHAREAALKRGLQLPGYELKERQGKSYVTNVAQAHEALGLPVADLLSCCTLQLNTSKKYPERRGVIDVYAKAHEIKTAPAKRTVKQKLSNLITTGKPTLSLVAVGDTNEEGEE